MSSTIEFDKAAAEEYDEKDHMKDFIFAVKNLLSSWKWLSSSKETLKILDFGCGTGTHTLGIAQYGHEVTAADVSPEMLNVLCHKLKNTPQEQQVTLVQSKEDGSGFASGHFDAVFIVFVMHHVAADQRQLVISNLTKTLKQGGRLVVLELEDTERSKASFASFQKAKEKQHDNHSKEKERTDDKKQHTDHDHDHEDHHGHKHDWLDRKTVASWMSNAGLNAATIVDASFEIPHKHGIMDCFHVTGIR